MEERLFEIHRQRARKIRDNWENNNGPDPRRRLERRDFEIVQEDPRAMANLSPKAIAYEQKPDRGDGGFVTNFIFEL